MSTTSENPGASRLPANTYLPTAGLEGWRTYTDIAMDTFITIALNADDADAADSAADRARAWFHVVEDTCSRFDNRSELARLTDHPGVANSVSPLLFELLRFAVELAGLTGGAFDPTVGASLEAAGFDREYKTGQKVTHREKPAERGSYRDIVLDAGNRTVLLRRPVVLDLGAVAKGMAVDLATQELRAFSAGCVDAGGDIRMWGNSPSGRAWEVGIQHPGDPEEIITTARVRSGAVCTSGGYERPRPDRTGHHLVSPRGTPTDAPASVTVLAPTALAADGLSTAAFVLGPRRSRKLLMNQGVEAIFIQPDLSIIKTSTLAEYNGE